jgi:hypothetical protein
MHLKKTTQIRLFTGGLSLLVGLPFFAAGISAALLRGKPGRGLSLTVIVVFLTWYLTGFQGAVIAAICTMVITIATRTGYPLLKVVYLSSASALLAGALLSLGFPGFMNIGENELTPLREVYLSAGLDSSTIDTVFSLITYYSPGIGAIHIVTGSILSVLFFKSLDNQRESTGITGKTRFRMYWGLAWVPIICLLILVIAGASYIPESVLKTAKNLLLFSALPYGIEGFQVAARWAKGVPGVAFMLIVSAVFAPPLVLGSLILLGILDTWFDYRKKIDLRIERMKNEGSSDQNS